MSRWLIRPERERDVDPIDAVVTAAFLHAPHTSHTEQHIVRALRRDGQLVVSLVGESEGAVVGHVAASPVIVSPTAVEGWFGLGPLSVHPDCQRRGLGAALVQHCLAALRAIGAQGCVVLGEPAYYGRFGFQAEPQLVLPGVPPEYFQAVSFRGPLPAGAVSYHAAFDTTG